MWLPYLAHRNPPQPANTWACALYDPSPYIYPQVVVLNRSMSYLQRSGHPCHVTYSQHEHVVIRSDSHATATPLTSPEVSNPLT